MSRILSKEDEKLLDACGELVRLYYGDRIAELEAEVEKWKQVAEDCACQNTKAEAIALYEAALESVECWKGK